VGTWQGLQLGLTDGPGRRVAAVAGEVDIATAGAMYVFLAYCIYGATSPCDLIVDLSAVTFMDARGLTVLVRADALACDLGVRLRIGEASECVTRILKVTGLSQRFMSRPVGPVSPVSIAGARRNRPSPVRMSSE
jgi:anti-anti-sigma factor